MWSAQSGDEVVDADGEAALLMREVGEEVPYARELAEYHLGPDCFVCWPGATRDAELVFLEGRMRIRLRRGLSHQRRRWAIMHEIAEWHLLERLRYRESDIEVCAEAITAALVMPRGPFRRMLAEVGTDFAALAEAFCATQTAAALRYGEVTRTPLAVVGPGILRVRGDERAWLADPDLVRWHANEGPPSGVQLRPLTDDPRRVVLVEAS